VTKCTLLARRIFKEKNADKRTLENFVVFPDHSTEKNEVKTMELANKTDRSAQAWTSRAEKRPRPRIDYYSELRSWVQHVILEAEKNKDFDKKDQFLSLLNDL
jgi:hypothetical protein